MPLYSTLKQLRRLTTKVTQPQDVRAIQHPVTPAELLVSHLPLNYIVTSTLRFCVEGTLLRVKAFHSSHSSRRGREDLAVVWPLAPNIAGPLSRKVKLLCSFVEAAARELGLFGATPSR